jgi:hypothetical protein
MPEGFMRETETAGVVYQVTSRYSAAGSLEELLEKSAMEAIRAGEDLSRYVRRNVL